MAVTQAERDSMIEWLRARGQIIGNEAKTGDDLAIEIIKWYEMWRRCPGDAASYVVLESKCQEWFKRRMDNWPPKEIDLYGRVDL